MKYSSLNRLRAYALSLYAVVPICVALQCLPATWSEALLLHRATYIEQWWQLLSAHFVHLSWTHLGVNMLGLAVLQQLFAAQLNFRHSWAGIIFIALAISGALLSLSPSAQWYAGFSGVLIGLYVYAALLALREQALLSGLVLCLIAAKVVAEQWQGATVDYSRFSALPVLVDAHLYGALAGLLWAATVCIISQLQRNDE